MRVVGTLTCGGEAAALLMAVELSISTNDVNSFVTEKMK
jgi:hypothetical protein